ncbi:translocation protein S66 [Boothiomyces sp. JEL0866]|nr:translocation protein S66 [Boothiomyces sp. JEL0866]
MPRTENDYERPVKQSLADEELIYRMEKRNLEFMKDQFFPSVQETYSILNIRVVHYIIYSYLRDSGYQLFKSKPKRKYSEHKDEAGYFPLNRAKFEYEELAEQYSPDDSTGKKVLVAALLKRAVEAVTRVFRIRDEKPPLQGMVKEGIVNEGLWEKLLAAEAEIELEMQELMEESNLYKPNWSSTFLQEVSQLVQMKMQQSAQQEQPNVEVPQEAAQQQEETPQPLDEEAERERIARELIEEEEKEKTGKKKSKK